MHDGSGQIVANRLAKRFGPVPAVQDLSFTVQPGSVTGFLGPNGAGKTTTLRMILGLVAPTSGFATINGVPFDRLGTPGRVVGAVLDAQGFHPRRTARKHLLAYTAAMGVDDRRADEVLGLVGLTQVSGRKPGGYSLGMRQRLALATALLGDPQVLVLDEPANGLDPEGMAWLRQFLRSFADSGRTVLISSHLLAEVQQTIDRVVIVNQGVTRYFGSLESLRASQRSRVLVQASDPVRLAEALRGEGLTQLESTPEGKLAVYDATARRIGDVAAAAGVALYEVNEEQVDLERLYFQLTGMTPGSPPQQQPPGPPPGGGWGPPPGQGPYGGMPPQGYPPQGYQQGQYGPGRDA